MSSLPPVARRVALVVLDERERLGFRSAADLARLAGTSDATVIRTVQRLGYAGLVELKSAVERELAPPTATERLRASLGPHHGEDSPGDLPAEIASRVDALLRLGSDEVRRSVAAAAEAIAAADRVLVNARGLSVGIAAYAAAQFARIGIDARTLGSAAGVTADDLLAVAAGDVVVAIVSGVLQDWHAVLFERCGAVDARIVQITDSIPPASPDSVVVRAGRGDPGGVASHVTTVAVIESIVIALAARDSSGATLTMDTLTHLRQQLIR